MSLNTTLSRFSKCGGDLHKHSRRFHNLDKPRKAYALDLIETGIDADKAIRRAKRYEPITQEQRNWLEYEADMNAMEAERCEQEQQATMAALYDNYAF